MKTEAEIKQEKRDKALRYKANLIARIGRPAYNRRYNVRYSAKRRILGGRTHGYCMNCRIEFPRLELTIDHIIPLISGGKNEKSNLQLICKPCHDKKDLKVNPSYKQTK